MARIIVDGHVFVCSKELQEALKANGFAEPSQYPKAPPVDWSKIPDEYIAVAMDGSGFRYAYTTRPVRQGIKWANPADPLGWFPADPGRGKQPWDCTGWQDSLVMRP